MYIVLEIQKNANGQVGTLVTSYEDRNQAEQKYHLVLSSAAVSDLPVHSAMILTESTMVLKQECYRHNEPQEIET